MKLADVKTYTEGVLKKWFPNKKTVIDKLGVDDNNELTFDGQNVHTTDQVFVKKYELLSAPIVMAAGGNSSNWQEAAHYILKDNINNYDYVLATVAQNYNDDSHTEYVGTFVVNTNLGQRLQWASVNWTPATSSSSAYGDITNFMGFVFKAYGKNFDICFYENYKESTIISIKGMKFETLTDPSIIAHNHDNLAILNKFDELTNGVLTYDGKQLIPESYKKTLWNGQLELSKTATETSPQEINITVDDTYQYDELKFVIDVDDKYQFTDTVMVGPRDSNKIYWLGKVWESGASNASGNHAAVLFKIKTDGHLLITAVGMRAHTHIYLKKVEGIKYGVKQD